MPFKTRRRKQTASERRFTFAEDKQSFSTNKVVYQSKADSKAPEGNTAPVKRIEETVNTNSDLLKIVSAAMVILIIQLVLSLTLR